MATTFTVSNEGAGADLRLTFEVDATANKDFTQADLDSGLNTATMAGNNKVGMGSAGDRVIGKVIKVEQDYLTQKISVRPFFVEKPLKKLVILRHE